jgi:hypothetical protein
MTTSCPTLGLGRAACWPDAPAWKKDRFRATKRLRPNRHIGRHAVTATYDCPVGLLSASATSIADRTSSP